MATYFVADPCVQTTKLFGNFGSGIALLTHWRSTLPEEEQSGVSLQQNFLGDCRLSKCNSTKESYHFKCLRQIFGNLRNSCSC